MANQSSEVLREATKGIIPSLAAGQRVSGSREMVESSNTLKPWMKHRSKVLCILELAHASFAQNNGIQKWWIGPDLTALRVGSALSGQGCMIRSRLGLLKQRDRTPDPQSSATYPQFASLKLNSI